MGLSSSSRSLAPLHGGQNVGQREWRRALGWETPFSPLSLLVFIPLKPQPALPRLLSLFASCPTTFIQPQIPTWVRTPPSLAAVGAAARPTTRLAASA